MARRWCSGASNILQAQGLDDKLTTSTHIVWVTGGGMVPTAAMDKYYQQGIFSCG